MLVLLKDVMDLRMKNLNIYGAGVLGDAWRGGDLIWFLLGGVGWGRCSQKTKTNKEGYDEKGGLGEKEGVVFFWGGLGGSWCKCV